MLHAFDRLIKNHTRHPLMAVVYTQRRGKSLAKELTFLFSKFIEIRQVSCIKCKEDEVDGARFEGKVSGGTYLRGSTMVLDLCQECCIKYGWGDSKLDEFLEAQLLGNKSW